MLEVNPSFDKAKGPDWRPGLFTSFLLGCSLFVVFAELPLGDEQLAVAELASTPAEAAVEAPVEVAESRGYSLKAASRAASREAERGLILKALARTRWNRKRAAQELQISYKSLLYKLKQIGVLDSEAD